MSDDGDTTQFVGGPIKRFGGKGQNASRIIPHLPLAKVYAEPFFGAGGLFFSLPEGTYERESVNDLDASLVTFFRVLRDRLEDLVRVCEATPYARAEFAACLEHSDDPLEEARRVWVRGRQGFSGIAETVGNWGKSTGSGATWLPTCAESKLAALRTYAARLRRVSIDCTDAVDFVDAWGVEDTAIYCDPPYVAESRGGNAYKHEMDEDHHRRLSVALHAAVARGSRVAISGYPSTLYDELYGGWRAVSNDVHLKFMRHGVKERRTEVLWCSYPDTDAIGYREKRQGTLF